MGWGLRSCNYSFLLSLPTRPFSLPLLSAPLPPVPYTHTLPLARIFMLRKEADLQGLNDLSSPPPISFPLPSPLCSHFYSPNWLFPLLRNLWLRRQSTSPLPNFTCNPSSPPPHTPHPTALLKATLVLLGINCPSFLPRRIKTSPNLLSLPTLHSPHPPQPITCYLRKTISLCTCSTQFFTGLVCPKPSSVHSKFDL